MSRVPGSPADPRDLTIAYDQLGNITQKAGIAYGYKNAPGETGCSATAGPHALSRYQNQFYCFDANGNNTQVRQAGQVIRSITYTGDDLPERIVRNEGTIQADATFRYGPDRARYKRIDNAAATSAGTCGGGADSIFCSGFEDGGLTTGSSTTYYLGNVEIIQQGTSAQIKRYVGDYLVVTRTESTSGSVLATAHDYLLRDHLGSIEVIVNGQGQVQQRLSFDAYGNRRVADPAGAWNLSRVLDAFAAASFDTSRTRRGFTGHEQLDALGLIHMNGRLYDPQIGRFIQADPLAEPDATQGLNRYSYVLNNPLSATDPTGYLSFRQVLGLAVGVGFSIWSGGLLAHSVIGSFFAATGGGFLSAVIATGSTKAGGWGALSAAMFWGIGQGFAGVAAANVRNGVATLRSGLTTGQTAAKIAAHAGAGGVLAELQGGSFGHGFIAAGVTQALNPAVAQIEGKGFTAITARTVVSATIGGTVSEITGGSFANGAATGAFQELFNSTIHGICDETCEYRQMRGQQQEVVDQAANTMSQAGDLLEDTYYAAIAGWAVRAGVAATSLALTSEVAGLGTGYRSYGAFKRAMGGAGQGREWHHIVEQTSGNLQNFGPYRIHNTATVVSLDIATHRRISAYYSSIDLSISRSMPVRQWLSTQSFDDQLLFGQRILQRMGGG